MTRQRKENDREANVLKGRDLQFPLFFFVLDFASFASGIQMLFCEGEPTLYGELFEKNLTDRRARLFLHPR